ncbi:MAG: DUF1501 domain-containing protein [Pseudomonadota bacterium]
MQDRRNFLKSSLAAGVSMSALPAFAQQSGDDYKALVCVVLLGGIDSQDCLVPTAPSGYGSWAKARSSIVAPLKDGSRARDGLVTLGQSAQGFGFVPEMRGLADLYRRGDLAVVSNTGPLLEPVTKRDIVDKPGKLPPRLASHNDQQSTWQTLAPEGAPTGWGGRMLDALGKGSDLAGISIKSNTSFVVGQTAPGVTVPPDGISLPFGISPADKKRFGDLSDLLEEHFRGVGQSPDSLFEQDVVIAQRRAYDASVKLAGLLDGNTAGDTAKIAENKLAKQLAMVAKMISIQKPLGLSRQVFAVRLGGFDTHRNQFEKLPGLQRTLSEALLAFQNTLNSMGVADQVTTFTVSDFGRTLISNASGTDHGWGGHTYVMGGAVRGGRVIGEIPPYDVGHDLDWRRGAMIPTISIEQYAGALGSWFGLDTDGLQEVFPNIGRFDRNAVKLF